MSRVTLGKSVLPKRHRTLFVGIPLFDFLLRYNLFTKYLVIQTCYDYVAVDAMEVVIAKNVTFIYGGDEVGKGINNQR